MKFYASKYTGEIFMATELKKRYGEFVAQGLRDPEVTSYSCFRDSDYNPVAESSLTEYSITVIAQSKCRTTIKAPSFEVAKKIVEEDFNNGELDGPDSEKIVDILCD